MEADNGLLAAIFAALIREQEMRGSGGFTRAPWASSHPHPCSADTVSSERLPTLLDPLLAEGTPCAQALIALPIVATMHLAFRWVRSRDADPKGPPAPLGLATR